MYARHSIKSSCMIKSVWNRGLSVYGAGACPYLGESAGNSIPRAVRCCYTVLL